MSQGVLEMVVSVAVGKGWPALYHVSEPGSCRYPVITLYTFESKLFRNMYCITTIVIAINSYYQMITKLSSKSQQPKVSWMKDIKIARYKYRLCLSHYAVARCSTYSIRQVSSELDAHALTALNTFSSSLVSSFTDSDG
jgi:hypothetical protein